VSKIPVAILGATGTVGQKFVRLLAHHPWFELSVLAASEQSAGQRYGDVVRWRETTPVPERAAAMIVRRCEPPLETPIVFSALDAALALPLEEAHAQAGAYVITNASAWRMEPEVPLLVPEVNAEHLGLVRTQHARKGWAGGMVANPNCSTAALVLALAPLHRAFGVERLFVSTMQAASGAGYPGVSSLDLLGNVIPYIGMEEEKIERETRKILGAWMEDGIAIAPIAVSAHTNRVPVVDGHTETVSVGFGRRVTPQDAYAVFEAFRAEGAVASLPSTPARPVELDLRPDRPQPRLDLERGGGMTVTVGRLRSCPLLDLRFVLLGHNTIRGAAGAAIQNAELLVAEGLVPR
jgi:aspartate-semialdehyde dehydrogenase